jgi:hypothetical protein
MHYPVNNSISPDKNFPDRIIIKLRHNSATLRELSQALDLLDQEPAKPQSPGRIIDGNVSNDVLYI